MNLHTHYPYSLLQYGLLNSYPSLKRKRKTDVVIIGAGITGALMAWQLFQKGIDFILVDKRHVATGSTAASTSLIQYEIDVPLYKLEKQVGFSHASKAYLVCREAVYGLQQLCRQLGNKDLFEPKCSLQFASYTKDVDSLEKEYKIRRSLGFEVDLLSHSEIKKDYHFDAPAALFVHEAGQLDAYVLTHKILERLPPDSVFDHTEIISTKKQKAGHLLRTSDHQTIQCKYLVIACGYESGKYLSKNVWEELRCTYALVSEPLPQREFWKDNCLIWETADPYLYVRTCEQNRVLVGGKDTEFLPVKKQLEMLPQKAKALKSAFEKKFRHLHIKVDFSWAGAFATTKDGLPYIGCVPGQPDIFFALGYGGNGITFSYIASQQLAAAIVGEKHPASELFSFNR